MIAGITMLLLSQLVGEALARSLGLPVPGAVLGFALLFVLLSLRRQVPAALRATSGAILANLSLLFVPAGVGVVQHLPRIQAEWLAITVALVASTLLALIAAATAFALVARLTGVAPGADASKDGA